MSGALEVVAGVLSDASGRVLVQQRRPDQEMPDRWEFPGGKLRAGESPRAGLKRELAEELGVVTLAMRPLIRFRHAYPQRAVDLRIYLVLDYRGTPRAVEGQPLRWIDRGALDNIELLEADRPIVTALRLPERYLITGSRTAHAERLARALARGETLIQLRAPELSHARFETLARDSLAVMRGHGAKLLLNGRPARTVDLARRIGAGGVHVPARFLDEIPPDVSDLLVGASCHDAAELEAAEAAGADFAVLGPVARTASHPDAEPLGWERFAALVAAARLPVYALGGMTESDLSAAWAAGGQGIAAISALW